VEGAICRAQCLVPFGFAATPTGPACSLPTSGTEMIV
jgi:hypothetical protein